MSPPIRLAIIGGGLAGATLAHALLKHPHILFNVYESKATFTESGYGVGLGPKAIAALEHIGPEMKDTLTASGAHQDLSQKIVMVSRPPPGHIPANSIVHRRSDLRRERSSTSSPATSASSGPAGSPNC